MRSPANWLALVLLPLFAITTNHLTSSVDIVLDYSSLLLSENEHSLHGDLDDSCGVCGGSNQRCAGCDGVANSGRVTDVCGVCGGSGSTCAQSCAVRIVTTTLEWAQDIIWDVDGGGRDLAGNLLEYGTRTVLNVHYLSLCFRCLSVPFSA